MTMYHQENEMKVSTPQESPYTEGYYNDEDYFTNEGA